MNVRFLEAARNELREAIRLTPFLLGARQLVRQDGWQAAIFGGHKRTSLLTVAHQLASASEVASW